MEYEFHKWLKSNQSQTQLRDGILLGIGDDAAILAPTDLATVVASDTIADGTHFDSSVHSLERIGRKALAVNLSDIAAMAATPHSTVITFMLPRKIGGVSFGLTHAQQLFKGVSDLANEFDVAIVGGDTNTWDGPLVVGATLLGRRDPNQAGWTIDGVKPGDGIVVSGNFGGSIHGRHLDFTPRVALANYVSSKYNINGATDVSDSLSLDLSSLAKSSGVGIDFAPEAVPVSDDVLSNDGSVTPEQMLEHALTDGEDFELILAVRQSEIAELMADTNVPCQLTVLGAATDEHLELKYYDESGVSILYTPKGYIH